MIPGVDDSTDAPEYDRPIYTLYTQDGAPCILVKTDAIFYINYRTLRHGIKTVRIVLPGKCYKGARDILNIFSFLLVIYFVSFLPLPILIYLMKYFVFPNHFPDDLMFTESCF
jgi:hypothetical protein